MEENRSCEIEVDTNKNFQESLCDKRYDLQRQEENGLPGKRKKEGQMNPPKGYNVRQATPQDATVMIDLVIPIICREYRIYNTSIQARRSLKDLKNLESIYFKTGGAFVILETNPEYHQQSSSQNSPETKKEMVGMVALLPRTSTMFELCRLYLKKEHRRNGLGCFLMEFAIEKAKDLGVSTLELRVAEAHQEAIKLYERYGFEQWIPDGKLNHNIFMRLHLN